jgi:hypothetical protein
LGVAERRAEVKADLLFDTAAEEQGGHGKLAMDAGRRFLDDDLPRDPETDRRESVVQLVAAPIAFEVAQLIPEPRRHPRQHVFEPHAGGGLS